MAKPVEFGIRLPVAGPLASVDAVRRIARATAGVRRGRVNLVRQGIVEEQLGCELGARRPVGVGPDLEVDVDRAPVVPARVDGRELHTAVRIGRLRAAEELEPCRRVVKQS